MNKREAYHGRGKASIGFTEDFRVLKGWTRKLPLEGTITLMDLHREIGG